MFNHSKNQLLASLDHTIEKLEALKEEASARHSLLLSKQLTSLRSMYFEVQTVVVKSKTTDTQLEDNI